MTKAGLTSKAEPMGIPYKFTKVEDFAGNQDFTNNHILSMYMHDSKQNYQRDNFDANVQVERC